MLKLFQRGIYVPAKKDIDGNVVLPAVRLGRRVEHIGEYTFQEIYNRQTTPTAAVLRHGFETVPAFRRAVKTQPYIGEVTRSAWRDGKELYEGGVMKGDGTPEGTSIESPEAVFKIPMPEDGWAKRYEHGVPCETTSDRDDAIASLQEQGLEGISYFAGNPNGVRPVSRGFHSDNGPFNVYAKWVPGDGSSGVGARRTERSSGVSGT